MRDARDALTEESTEEFGELLRFTIAGYVGGLAAAALLDRYGLQRSGLGQSIVRTLSGEGESLLEGFYALRQRLSRARGSMAEAYAWGKLLGTAAPWVIDGASRFAGVDVYGVEGFYIPFFYAMSDQIGASLSGFTFLRRRTPTASAAFGAYFRHPVMLAGLAVILAVPFGLAAARLVGFTPSTQLLTAAESIAANLCWVPPLVGWIVERHLRRDVGR